MLSIWKIQEWVPGEEVKEVLTSSVDVAANLATFMVQKQKTFTVTPVDICESAEDVMSLRGSHE